MKRFLIGFVAVLFLVFICFQVSAAPLEPSNPKKVLSKATIDKFINDFPKMASELAVLGADFEETFGGVDEDTDFSTSLGFDPNALRRSLTAAMADKRVKAVFDKYKWTNTFADEYTAIMFCYIYATFDEQAAFLPPEMLAAMLDPFAPHVNKSDLALVKANLEPLNNMFENID